MNRIIREVTTTNIKFTKEGIYWVISSIDEPNATERYTNKNTALDMFAKAIQVDCVDYYTRNSLLRDARKLGRGKLRGSKK